MHAGTQLTPEQLAAWPALRLLHLRLSRTQVTPAGLVHLQDLPCPRLLDLRGTSVKRMALLPLQRRWGLHPLQGGAVLADSVGSSIESSLGRGLVCACGQRPLQGGPISSLLQMVVWKCSDVFAAATVRCGNNA